MSLRRCLGASVSKSQSQGPWYTPMPSQPVVNPMAAPTSPMPGSPQAQPTATADNNFTVILLVSVCASIVALVIVIVVVYYIYWSACDPNLWLDGAILHWSVPKTVDAVPHV